MPDNVPEKQHYLPQFYLKRWAVNDGELIEFSRPNPNSDRVIATPRIPKGTGFEKNLYDFEGLPPEKRALIETELMQKIDTNGDRALRLLETNAAPHQWNSDLRQWWFMFMTSLLIRTPADIAALKEKYANDWMTSNDKWETQYSKERTDDDPPTAAAYFSSFDRRVIDNFALRLLPSLVNLPSVGRRVMNMHWFTIKLASDERFMTSDRPIIKTDLGGPSPYWLMPIGPDRLFIAVNHWKDEINIHAHKTKRLVSDVNQAVVGRAVKLAFGTSLDELAFAQAHHGRHSAPSMFSIGRLGNAPIVP